MMDWARRLVLASGLFRCRDHAPQPYAFAQTYRGGEYLMISVCPACGIVEMEVAQPE